MNIKRYGIANLMLGVACMMVLSFSTGCSSSKNATKRPPVQVERADGNGKSRQKGNSGLKGKRKRIVDEALTWVGTPYKYAFNKKGKGTDCSGLVITVYEEVVGKKLPRNSREQAEYCRKLSERSVKPGDLVFFATGRDSKKISHVGIMIDDTRFVHASTKKGVIISDMLTDYYRRTFRMYGRVPE